MRSTLGKTLIEIDQYKYRTDGSYTLFIPCDVIGEKLSVDTPCIVLFYTSDQLELTLKNPEYNHPDAKVIGYCELSDVRMAQEIVHAAILDKEDCSPEDLVYALEYYFDHDGFYNFSSDTN